MSSPPLIGITSNLFPPAERRFYKGKALEYGEQSLATCVARAGGIPVMLFRGEGGPQDQERLAAQVIERMQGLVLSAGSDVAPESYGQAPLRPEWAGEIHRDRWEIALYHAAIEAGIPVLGVCRGCQLLNVAEGGTLWQDVVSEQGCDVHRSQELYCQLGHTIQVVDGTVVATLFDEEEPRVNSVHHQSLRELGQGLAVSALSPDGVVEAVEREGAPWVVGIQWHPEWMPEAPSSLRLLDLFVQRALGS